jgi:WhiB family redox-sensing transcriptional regulator
MLLLSINKQAIITLRNSFVVTINLRSQQYKEHQETMDWRHQSACREEDPELFFPVGNTGPALAQIEEAQKVCERCVVKEACLAWALESGQDAGVWGGLSEDERRALKRRAARNRARMMESQNQF